MSASIWCGRCGRSVFTPLSIGGEVGWTSEAHTTECGEGWPQWPGVGPGDEPEDSGALVATWYGDYRRQQVWVSSGANIGNWYPLGGEFGRPKVWRDPRGEDTWIFGRGPVPQPGPGEVPLHPVWEDVLRFGPVTVLTSTNAEAYARGWRNGVAAVRAKIDEQLEWLEIDPKGGP